jgi:hypothetical protein
MDYAKIAWKLREQMVIFSGELSSGLPKVVRRFIAEMIYGIQARQSVRLTEVARALGETITMKKTEERLSRQLGRADLWESLKDRILEEAAERIQDLTLLVLDITDISKKYARKMEHLARIRDGSEKTLANGYWVMTVVGAETNQSKIVPLYGRLYSQRAPEHESENVEIEQALKMVSSATEKRGIWVIDRGGDREELYQYLLHNKLRFLIRLRGDRMLKTTGGERSALDVAQRCPMLYKEYIAKTEGGEEKPLCLEFGFCRVQLPDRPEMLTMVVIRGFGQEPLMVLTNLRVRLSRKSVWHVVTAYMTRWRIEETIRFIKQSYELEDVRLLTYRRLQNLMALVIAVVYFTAVYLGIRLRLRVLARYVIRAARRVFGIPDFRLYALADGIKHCLFSRSQGLRSGASPPILRFAQLHLFNP